MLEILVLDKIKGYFMVGLTRTLCKWKSGASLTRRFFREVINEQRFTGAVEWPDLLRADSNDARNRLLITFHVLLIFLLE